MSAYTFKASDEYEFANILLRPDGTEVCALGEPEDRNFARDARPVVVELNDLCASHADLLAALEELADSASMLDVEFVDDEEQAEAEAVLGRARAAIARARGGK